MGKKLGAKCDRPCLPRTGRRMQPRQTSSIKSMMGKFKAQGGVMTQKRIPVDEHRPKKPTGGAWGVPQ